MPNQQTSVIQNTTLKLSQYPKWFRKVEWLSIICFFTLSCYLILKISSLFKDFWFTEIIAFFAGWIVADFSCGLVHWLADTWGSPDIPILGMALIRPFREHHVDQMAMTHHDFIETNGATSLMVMPILLVSLFLPIGSKHPITSFIFSFIIFMSLFSFLTNQIHKWAHSKQCPKFVRYLQKKRLILNPRHHQIHHTPPFDKYYCITNGWLNKFLFSIKFFPTVEKLITKYTKRIPRSNDLDLTLNLKDNLIHGRKITQTTNSKSNL